MAMSTDFRAKICGAADPARLRSGLRQRGRERPFLERRAAAAKYRQEPDFRREKQIPRA